MGKRFLLLPLVLSLVFLGGCGSNPVSKLPEANVPGESAESLETDMFVDSSKLNNK